MSDPTYNLARSVQGLKIHSEDPCAERLFRIPSHSLLTLLGPHRRAGMVEVDWQGGHYAVFAIDLEERCRNRRVNH